MNDTSKVITKTADTAGTSTSALTTSAQGPVTGLTVGASGSSLGHATRGFSRNILNFGFKAAVVLAGLCFVLGACYLGYFLVTTSGSIVPLVKETQPGVLDIVVSARMVMARFALLSTGVFAGLAFGFLGFALFLIGIEGDMGVDAESETYKLKLARISPGVFVMLVAALLIGICATRSTPFDYSRERPRELSTNVAPYVPSQSILNLKSDTNPPSASPRQ
jgi:hypothetical protein